MPTVAINTSIPTLCVHQPLDSTAKLNYTYRNKLVNGGFNVWQRGVTFALLAPSYTADRWYISNPVAVTREAFLPGESELMDNAKYYLKNDLTVSLPASMEQRIEGVETLAGKQVTLTFWAKSGISGSIIPITIIQNFGTTGSPSTSVTTVVGSATLTAAWVKHTMTVTLPSIAGKTLGTDGNDYVALKITLPVDAISICNMQLEQGPLATDFEIRPYDEEVRLCRRYYEQIDLNLDQVAFSGIGISGTEAVFVIPYQEKRIVPAITVPSTLKIYLNANTPTWSDTLARTLPTVDLVAAPSKVIGNKFATVASGLVAGTVVLGTASAACSVLINAEL